MIKVIQWRQALQVLAVISLCGPASRVPAADAESSATAATELAEIVVTAQRREEQVNRTAVTIDAFNGAELKDAGAATVRDMAFYTPSLSIKMPLGENSYPEISLRGMSADNFDESSPQVVGVYVDGIYMTSAAMLAFPLLDQERVEVLKGPQGTLYGRNTTAGAINFISREPTFTPEGYVDVGYGSYDRVDFEGAAGGPLTDVLAGRIAAKVTRQFSGPQVQNSPDANSGQVNAGAARASLLFKPDDQLRILWNLHAARDYSETWPFSQVAALIPQGQPGAGQLCPQFLAGNIAAANRDCADVSGYHKTSGDPFNNPLSYYGRHHDYSFGSMLQADWDVNDVMRLTSVTGYDRLNRNEGLDEGASTAVLINTIRGANINQLSEEVRLASTTNGPLSWILGAYGSVDSLLGSPIFVSNFRDWFGASVADYSSLRTKTWAVFGQSEYALSDRLSFVGGVRETGVLRTFHYSEQSAPTGGGFSTGFAGSSHLDQSSWSGKIGVNYRPAEDALLYASIARGFDAGTFNSYFLTNDAALEPTRPETVTTFEIGVKDRVLPGLQVNAAMFYSDWKDIILTEIENRAGVNAPYLTNGKGATIAGGELEAFWVPITSLQITLGGSYVYQSLKDLYEQNLFGQTVNLKGGRLANSPEFQFNGSLRYNINVARDYRLVPQFDVKWEARAQRDLLDTQALISPAHLLVNGRIALENTPGKWSVAVWVHNLTDKVYVTEAYQVVAAGMAGVVYNMPRTAGVTLEKKF